MDFVEDAFDKKIAGNVIATIHNSRPIKVRLFLNWK